MPQAITVGTPRWDPLRPSAAGAVAITIKPARRVDPEAVAGAEIPRETRRAEPLRQAKATRVETVFLPVALEVPAEVEVAQAKREPPRRPRQAAGAATVERSPLRARRFIMAAVEADRAIAPAPQPVRPADWVEEGLLPPRSVPTRSPDRQTRGAAAVLPAMPLEPLGVPRREPMVVRAW